MVVLDVVVTRSAFVQRRLQEPHQGVAAVSAGGFVFHVEKVAGGFKRREGGVLHVVGEQPGAFGGGVFVPFAVHEQHRYVDSLRSLEKALAITVQQVADVEVHLPVFVLGQAADMPIIEALEQRGQVFADGVVDQVTNTVAVEIAEVVDTALQIIAHRFVDHR